MREYKKPIVLVNSDVAEGVYAASGDCYTFTADIVQTPLEGMQYYVIQINGIHAATDDHHSTERTVKLTFNQPVTYKFSNAASYSGDGTNVLYLTYIDSVNGSYHNNGGDKIGLGNLEVYSEPGLAINGKSCTYCNRDCTDYGH